MTSGRRSLGRDIQEIKNGSTDSTSMDPASYGVLNSVPAFIFILDLADNMLKDQI
jgi:hypothetical protein